MRTAPPAPPSLERLVPALLAALTFTVYCQVGEHDFVNYDDGKYVLQNAHLEQGLSFEGTAWAFTTTYFSNWHPLTWLSYLADYELWGLKPGGYHLTNLLLHVLGTLLLFAGLRRMTGALWRSALVAALFGLHPLHVESVAWVSERKDVLSGVFFMATLWAYAHYAARPSWRRYAAVASLMALGLMAKPMLVTLPFVLLLLDYWPLERLRGESSRLEPGRIRALVAEKTPLFLLSAGSCWITLVAQRNALVDLEVLPLDVRLINAVIAYVAYIWKAVWPVDLAVLYPHPGAFPAGLALASLLILAGTTALVWRLSPGKPYLPVGWLLYLGMLVPVIGLVQVGRQAMADRYTYLPLMGLFLIAAWGAHDLLSRSRRGRGALTVASIAVLCALFACTWIQVSRWRDSVTLFRHTLRVTSENGIAHFNLGSVLMKRGQQEEGIEHLTEALRLNPRSYRLQANIATIMANHDRPEAAALLWGLTIWGLAEEYGAPSPSEDAAGPAADHLRAGLELARHAQLAEAVSHFEEALRLEPTSLDARLALATAQLARNERSEAMSHYRAALELRPEDARVHYKVGLALMLDDRMSEALEHVAYAVREDPENRAARFLLREIRRELATAANRA